jgi:hypothetical protein
MNNFKEQFSRRLGRLALGLTAASAAAASGGEHQASASSHTSNPLEQTPNPIIQTVSPEKTAEFLGGIRVSEVETNVPGPTPEASEDPTKTPTPTPTETETQTQTPTETPSPSPSPSPTASATEIPSLTPSQTKELIKTIAPTRTLEATKKILTGTWTYTPSPSPSPSEFPSITPSARPSRTPRATVPPTLDRGATRTAAADNKTATADAKADAAASKTQDAADAKATGTAVAEVTLTQRAFLANGLRAASADLTPTPFADGSPTATPTLQNGGVEVASNGPVENETSTTSTKLTPAELKALSPDAVDGVRALIDGFNVCFITDIPGLDMHNYGPSTWKDILKQANQKVTENECYFFRSLDPKTDMARVQNINDDKIYPQVFNGAKAGEHVLFAWPKDGFYPVYVTSALLADFQERGRVGHTLAVLALGSRVSRDVKPEINAIPLSNYANQQGINVGDVLSADYIDPASVTPTPNN